MILSFLLLTLPLPPISQLPEPIQEKLAEVPPLNIYRMMANVPHSFLPYMDFAESIFTGELSSRLREIIFLRQAHLINASYEWHQHVFLAKANGVTDAEIKSIQKSRVKNLSPEENFLCQVTDELTQKGNLSNATFDQLTSRYSPSLATEIILNISFANMLGRFVNATRVPIEPTDPLKGLATPTQ